MPETRGDRLKKAAEILGGPSKLGIALETVPSGLYKYFDNKQSLGKKLGGRLTNAGINYDWYLTGQGSMFADNEAGRKLAGETGAVGGIVKEATQVHAAGKSDKEYIEELLKQVKELETQNLLLQERVNTLNGVIDRLMERNINVNVQQQHEAAPGAPASTQQPTPGILPGGYKREPEPPLRASLDDDNSC